LFKEKGKNKKEEEYDYALYLMIGVSMFLKYIFDTIPELYIPASKVNLS